METDHLQRPTTGEVRPAPSPDEGTVTVRVSAAHWLADDHLLLLFATFGPAAGHQTEVSLIHARALAPLKVHSLTFPHAGHGGQLQSACHLVAVRLPADATSHRDRGSLALRLGQSTLILGPDDLAELAVDTATLLREHLAGLDADTRTQILDFLGSALDHAPTPAYRRQLSRNLYALREGLRERFPGSVIAPDYPRALHVDAVLAIDERFFCFRGWVHDQDAKLTSLRAVSPEGCRTDLLRRAFYYPRPDVDQFYGSTSDEGSPSAGFIAATEIAVPSILPTGWVLQIESAGGGAVEFVAPPVTTDPIVVRDTLLADLAHERLPHQSLRIHQIYPAMSRLLSRLHKQAAIASQVEYGTVNRNPEVSIVVPLYQRIDFVEHQLAEFADDPDLRRAELIYVLDSPETEPGLTELAAQLFRLYRFPFRVVTLRQNAGFAIATNVGASVARGRLLLLLNSDVIPDRPGWLGTMVAAHDATPNVGALGPKLLYEDDSIQHAGLYFARPAGAELWQNRHYFKGLHRGLPEANVPRPVPAVTGACLLIDRSLYADLGGLSGQYVQGDFEDSDLCLRLIGTGHENWYVPTAELYHLEGQSYPGQLRQLTYQYNAWLHTYQLDDQIRTAMERYPSPSASLPPVVRRDDYSWRVALPTALRGGLI